jgi:hypothetical protein
MIYAAFIGDWSALLVRLGTLATPAASHALYDIQKPSEKYLTLQPTIRQKELVLDFIS